MSALHYDVETLDEGDEKHQRHAGDMLPSQYTNVFIDGEHAGVGGIDSWSHRAEAIKTYQIKGNRHTMTFSIEPMTGNIK